ncbi:MAG: mobile mystery protein B [Gammaproteobacteria bacterium]|nr:MAG: mobile mystery protein B [Gammaproteobacteria bacterium]
MDDKTKIADATYGSDLSGLKLDKNKTYSTNKIYFLEAQNILKASLDYLGGLPNKKSASFNAIFLLKLHKEMFGDVWDWAGKIRTVELNFGVKAYFVATELKKLADDLDFWQSNKSFDAIEIATRLDHRAVVIHPFLNGNGRWSRMLANIYLKQNGLSATGWNENLLAKENIHRGDYIQALKQADNGSYNSLIKLRVI